MNIAKLLFLLSFTFCFIPTIKAQGLAVNAGMKEDSKTVIIRWFSEETFNVDGVNVYKREKSAGDWVKLNTLPIKRIEKADTNTGDQKLLLYNSLIYDKPKDAADIESWHLMQIAQGVADPDFSKAFGMEYDDNSVDAGKTYEYKIVRLANGSEAEGQISNPVKIENYKPAEAPESFTATTGDKSVSFKWKTDKKRYFFYNLFRSENANGKFIKINSVPVFVFSFKGQNGNSISPEYYYRDTSLVNGKNYYYTIEGVDFLGRSSAKSPNVKVTPQSLSNLSSFSFLNGKANGNKVTIIWKLAADINLQGFNIYRGLTPVGKYEKINKKELHPVDTSYVDVITNPESAYYYYIETVNKTGNNVNSSYVFVPVPDMTPPGKPENLRGVGNVGNISITWNQGKDKNLLGYYIFRSLSSNLEELLLLTPFPLKINSYTDTLKKESQNFFYYMVKAVSKNYVTSLPSEIVKIKMKDVTPPAIPVITNAWFDKGNAEIEWEGDIEEDLAGYDIYRSSLPDFKPLNKINKNLIPAGKNNFIDSVLESGVYYYAVTARDTNGNVSDLSTSVIVHVANVDTLLQAPAGVEGVYDNEKKTISLNWKKILKPNLKGYIVFKKEEGVSVIISGLITETHFVDKEPFSGKNIYKIRAYDNSGNISESQDFEMELK